MTPFQRLDIWQRAARYRWQVERAELGYILGRDFSGGTVLDIGAFRGVCSYWMHRRFPDTQVVAFEPQPELAKYLADLKQSFQLDRLHVAPVGLSSHSGMLRMHRPRKHWGAATVDEFCYEDDNTESFNVPVTTIDEYLAAHPELGPVKFIKCDVEYHETEVLAGAERTLQQDRPELLVEWSTPRHSYRERLFKLTQRLDYAIYQFECGRLAPCTTIERTSPPSWELGPNYLLVPREVVANIAA